MTSPSDKIRHHQIDLTLTRGEWEMMGFHEYNGKVLMDTHAPYVSGHVRDACLLIAAASASPAATYVAALAEHNQAMAARSAIVRLADAIQQHGTAIERREIADVLGGVMQQLTERTQWAVRSQLRGSGMLPQ